ncbi:MAG: alpha/beta hydrolase [Myxococcota bacterium]|nr:alpha/beta hydrolase [Myxococcota bacterium]MDW8363962.1 alpha/beta fold hydrolase [Myxococcales bacterium]
MILRSEQVEQTIDADRRVELLKQVVRVDGPQPLAMIRKRLPQPGAQAPAVLLVHGFGQNRYTWHTDRRSFSAHLAACGFDVFVADLRGHGRSRRLGARRPRVMDEYILEDVPALAHAALALAGQERIFLVGHSMGGLIAYGAAAGPLRDRVRGIVSLGSPYRFGLGSRTLVLLRTLLGALRHSSLGDGRLPLPLRHVGRLLRRQRRLWDSPLVPMPIRAWAPGSVEPEVLEHYLARAFDRTSLAVAYDILRYGQQAALGSEASAGHARAFEALDVPLLVIAGSLDRLAPPPSVRPAHDRSRSSDKAYRVFPHGHVDLVLGRRAPATVWATIRTWLLAR